MSDNKRGWVGESVDGDGNAWWRDEPSATPDEAKAKVENHHDERASLEWEEQPDGSWELRDPFGELNGRVRQLADGEAWKAGFCGG